MHIIMMQTMRRDTPDNSEGLKLVSVRLPVSMHERLVLATTKDRRSVNAQINLLIEQYVQEFEAELAEAA